MTRPRMRIGAVTITAAPAPHARELARFYEQLLGWRIVDEGPKGGWVQLHPPEGETDRTLLGINIESDQEHERPTWPSKPGGQNATMHLDIGVDDLDEAVAWALQAGASLAEDQPQEHVRVMLDPHGNPFCLCR
ncbi:MULTISPECIES: VOC family protein [unclassified Kribbella]|uniref:VOC family protein n=1 Tax=unclassified Kribbella TaxID=2644121 RepID=UPI0033C1F7E6